MLRVRSPSVAPFRSQPPPFNSSWHQLRTASDAQDIIDYLVRTHQTCSHECLCSARMTRVRGGLASRRGIGNAERIRQTTESCLGRMVEARCRTPCLSLWAINSAGQSTRLITGVSQVRVLDGPPWGYDGTGRHWGLKIPCFVRAGSNPAIPTSLCNGTYLLH